MLLRPITDPLLDFEVVWSGNDALLPPRESQRDTHWDYQEPITDIGLPLTRRLYHKVKDDYWNQTCWNRQRGPRQRPDPVPAGPVGEEGQATIAAQRTE